MDGGRVFPEGTSASEAERDLKELLEGLTRRLFGADAELRWREDYFPFTLPSWELDVKFNGEWMELLGSGLIHPEIMRQCGLERRVGWAFGMGLERLSMVLYKINDIRAFWSRDDRFARQFRGLPLDAPIVYAEYSKFPKTSRDISFWLNAESGFHQHHFFELVREVCGEWVECVEQVDSFKHPKTGRTSLAFRIDYRSMEKTLDSAEVNAVQENLRQQAVEKLNVTLR
jgi:phenylalanyl-tRNA synthetase alpha chain